MNRLTALSIGLIFLIANHGPVLAEDDITTSIESIYQKNELSIVYIKYMVEMNFMGRTTNASSTVLGLTVSEDGLVMASDQMVQGGGMFGDRVTVSKPDNIVVTFTDGKERKGEYISRDQDIGVAFLQLKKESEDEKFSYIDFSGTHEPSIGEEVVLLFGDTSPLQGLSRFGRVVGVFKQPQYWTFRHGLFNLFLIFSESGRHHPATDLYLGPQDFALLDIV